MNGPVDGVQSARVVLGDLDAFLAKEAARCDARRAQFAGGGHVCFDPSVSRWRACQGNWALALSGGGIRSATFSLGVLQAMAARPSQAPASLPDALQGPLLPRFDYVSSVSGGGFVAGFVQGLYAPRLNEGGMPVMPGANAACAHLAEEPPGRVKRDRKPTPLAWLRENGRYLAPSGSGDVAYAAGMSIRNWLGVQSLFGVLILFLTCAAAVAEPYIAGFLPRCVDLHWWTAPLLVCGVWVLPSAGAYWMTREIGTSDRLRVLASLWRRTRTVRWIDSSPLRRLSSIDWSGTPLPFWRTVLVAAAGIYLFFKGAQVHSVSWAWPLRLSLAPLLVTWAWPIEVFLAPFAGADEAWRRYCMGAGGLLCLSALWAAGAMQFSTGMRTPARFAVTLTRCFTRGVQAMALLAIVALVFKLGRALLGLDLSVAGHPFLALGGGAGGLAAAYRLLMKVVPALRGGVNTVMTAKKLSRRALGAVMGLMAAVVVVGTLVFWIAVAYWLMVACGVLAHTGGCGAAATVPCSASAKPLGTNAHWLLLLSGLFVAVAGVWTSILNMSGYHYFYSARIGRAYLGAANPERTTAGSTAEQAPCDEYQPTSPADPLPGDQVAYQAYHANLAAPIHLINATCNQTVDPAEQLVQRDRKGQPFTVLPDLDNAHPGTVQVSIGDTYRRARGNAARLGMSDWLAISGAAVSTGLGRQTSVGASICATFANARIGRWWPGGAPGDKGIHWLLPTYAYLWDELTGRFRGTNRKQVYLTDGGHFENTATYELLRRARHPTARIRFVVMCDCGADPDYRYDDLANLIRLARIDFRLEVEVDNTVAASGHPLSEVFGTPDTMGRADPGNLDNRCAILLNVLDHGRLLARIVVIKPRMIRAASMDLHAYHRGDPAFPQQSTGDQFFDEAQWESYRKLGIECSSAVFALGEPFWHAVLQDTA